MPNGVEFTLVSPDGDQAFPVTMTAKVKYTIAANTARLLGHQRQAHGCQLTNHSYFNLRAHDQETILDEKPEINADKFTPVNADLIPTGKLAPVSGTPSTSASPKSPVHASTRPLQIKLGGG